MNTRHSMFGFRRPPVFGRRLKWMTVFVTVLIVGGELMQHWWNGWVRHGLGW